MEHMGTGQITISGQIMSGCSCWSNHSIMNLSKLGDISPISAGQIPFFSLLVKSPRFLGVNVLELVLCDLFGSNLFFLLHFDTFCY
jgi:hypothetical protein